MGITVGPIDLLKLSFETVNLMLVKGIITYDEARLIIKKSLDPKLSDEQKEKIVDSIVIKNGST